MKRAIVYTDKVYLEACKTYQQDEVTPVIHKLLDGICKDNGYSDFKGKRILLKPNLLSRREPDAGVTTKPSFVIAAAKYFADKGASVTLADSPGGVYHPTLMKSIYKTTKMDEASDLLELNYNVDFEKAKYGKREFNIISPAMKADYIVNLCRMKTHALCDMTAAVKNLFGTIPGLQKAEAHAKYSDKKEFSEFLVDLCQLNAPTINIIDGIVGMEGDGPANGTPIKTGVVIGSANPFAADLLCSDIMGFKQDEVDTVRIAVERKLCPDSVKKLNIIGENPENYHFNFVRANSGKTTAGGILKMVPGFIKRIIDKKTPHPFIDKNKCIGCGECARCCPMETIRITDKKAVINYEKCIKCFCCQELCPQNAVIVKKFRNKK